MHPDTQATQLFLQGGGSQCQRNQRKHHFVWTVKVNSGLVQKLPLLLPNVAEDAEPRLRCLAAHDVLWEAGQVLSNKWQMLWVLRVHVEGYVQMSHQNVKQSETLLQINS